MFWICCALLIAGLICMLILFAGAIMEERMDDDYDNNDEP